MRDFGRPQTIQFDWLAPYIHYYWLYTNKWCDDDVPEEHLSCIGVGEMVYLGMSCVLSAYSV